MGSLRSRQNNAGSVPNADYRNYDYASHHVDPFGPGRDSGRHSPIDNFCDEPHEDKEMSLGCSTGSTPESEEKHRKSMKAYLAAIERELPQASAGPDTEQAEEEHVGSGQAGQERAGAEPAGAKQGMTG